MEELCIQELEELWGGPLPEIESVFHEMGAEFVGGRKQLAPYVMKWFFSLEEANLAILLPGTAVEIAAKIGISEDEAKNRLDHLARSAKIMKTQSGYERFTNLGLFKDFLFSQNNIEEVSKQNGAKLFLAWEIFGDFFDADMSNANAPKKMMRIVPKWEAIKNIPGVMPCENMPEMLLSGMENLVFTKCPCRVSSSLARSGNYKTDMCRTGLVDSMELDHGVCLMSGWRGAYYKEVFGFSSHTREEVLEKIKQVEEADTYYCARNARNAIATCNCCDDCGCGVRTPFDRGAKDWFAKSRFLAYNDDPDVCTGCGLCEKLCPFEKSVHLTDGKAVVDEDRCHGCGVCVVKCPAEVLQMKLVRPASYIPETWIMKDPLVKEK